MLSDTVLFLDIDGVLCTLRSHFAFQNPGGINDAWDVTSCLMLNRLCQKHNMAIVISSTWRASRMEILQQYMSLHYLDRYLYGDLNRSGDYYAVHCKDKSEWTTPHDISRFRGKEIDAWLALHPSVKKFVIVDDDSDFHPHQKPFHVKTDNMEGFGARNYIQIDEYLLGKQLTCQQEFVS
jgi:hypothetical protein